MTGQLGRYSFSIYNVTNNINVYMTYTYFKTVYLLNSYFDF